MLLNSLYQPEIFNSGKKLSPPAKEVAGKGNVFRKVCPSTAECCPEGDVVKRDSMIRGVFWKGGVTWRVRGPESTFRVPNKEMIRVQQRVLFVQASIGWHHCRTWNPIGPHNWSTVMWPAPIGWWRRASPAIYITRAQDPGFFGIWSFWWAHPRVQAVRYTSGSSPCCERSPVERVCPTTFHSVYCLGVSPTSTGGLECPVVCDTYVLCTENI